MISGILKIIHANWGNCISMLLMLFTENVRQLGSHTLQLQAVLNETGANTYAGKTLPLQRFKFTVTGKSDNLHH